MTVLYIIIAIVVIIVLYFLFTYNSLVNLRNRVKDQWAQDRCFLKKKSRSYP